MKILVLSDSHSSKRFIVPCVKAVQPDAVIHLGDYSRDALALRLEFPGIQLYSLPGNCDNPYPDPDSIQIRELEGVRFYMTHGHLHNVKSHLYALVRDAREAKADIALYGHTHRADIHREEDGLWVVNPGSAGFYAGTAAVIEISGGQIQSVRLVKDAELPKH